MPQNSSAGFQLMSKEPLVYAWPGFASAEECDALIAHAEAARAFARESGAQIVHDVHGFQRVLQLKGKIYADVDPNCFGMSSMAKALVDRFDNAVATFVGVEPSAGQWQSVVHCTPQSEAELQPGLLNGLHVDTFNNARLRFATSLLYLRSIECGGETMFAAAADLGADLLRDGIESTLQDECRHSLKTDIEASCRPFVTPDGGTLLLFFVRRPDGQVDPAAFHGSARPLSGDKWTLQTFWACPAGVCPKAFARECHKRRDTAVPLPS